MQSHASIHIVSEFLKDLHPDLSPPFPKAAIKDEIAVAYGRRSVPKLVGVLSLDELPDDQRAHCLRVLNSLLSTQEDKSQAISCNAAEPLTKLLQSQCTEVRVLSCRALSSMCQLLMGRAAVVRAGGLQSLAAALQDSPEAAAHALMQMSTSIDGVAYLQQSPADVMAALVQLISRGPPVAALLPATACIAGMCTTDAGILQGLQVQLPRCIVALATRGLPGGDLANAAEQLLEECAKCLLAVSHHALGKTQIREAEGIEVLGHLLSTRSGTCIKRAAAALMSLSIEKESKVVVMRAAGARLVELLVSPLTEEDTAENCRAALVNSSEDLAARAALVPLLEGKDWGHHLGSLLETPPDFRYSVHYSREESDRTPQRDHQQQHKMQPPAAEEANVK